MKVGIDIKEEWVDDLIGATLREFIRKYPNHEDAPIDSMLKVLEYYSVHEDYVAFIEDVVLCKKEI